MKLPTPVEPVYEGERLLLVPIEAYGEIDDGLPQLAEDMHRLVAGDRELAALAGAYATGAFTNSFLTSFFNEADPASSAQALEYLSSSSQTNPNAISTYAALLDNEVVGIGERFPSAYSFIYSSEAPKAPVLALNGLQRLFISRFGAGGNLHLELMDEGHRGLAHLTGGRRLVRAFPLPVIKVPHEVELPEELTSHTHLPLGYSRARFSSFAGGVLLQQGTDRLALPERQIYYQDDEPLAA